MRSKSALTRIVDMWILRHLKDPGLNYISVQLSIYGGYVCVCFLISGQCYVLPKGKELVIGRRGKLLIVIVYVYASIYTDCDILLRSDSSVSRKHALLLITDDNKVHVKLGGGATVD